MSFLRYLGKLARKWKPSSRKSRYIVQTPANIVRRFLGSKLFKLQRDG